MPAIKTIKGNLLGFSQLLGETDRDLDTYVGINAKAHSCNCRMIMGVGIAKQIKNRYPEAYQADVNFTGNDDENGQYIHPLGNFSKAEINLNFYRTIKAIYIICIPKQVLEMVRDEFTMKSFGKH